MKKIYFNRHLESSESIYQSPSPAINELPEWYKKMDSFYDNNNKLSFNNGELNQTIKRCVPVRDSLGLGYLLKLQSDIFVKQEDGLTPKFDWIISEKQVTEHSKEQLQGFPVPHEHFPVPYKWMNWKLIKTPPGYSTMFVHPLHRYDLPFTTLSGVVDTDKHNDLCIHFPFFIKNGFNGIIEKNTPIVQLIPFKRDSWKMIEGEPIDQNIGLQKHDSKLINFYKNNSWTRKEFK